MEVQQKFKNKIVELIKGCAGAAVIFGPLVLLVVLLSFII